MFDKKYAEHYDHLNQEKQYKKEVEFIYNWARHPKTILDIGCGTAHYWKFYPKSVEMIGVEKSKDMISASPYKNLIHCADLNNGIDFSAHGSFELVTALFDVINYIQTNDWWGRLPIIPGGYFVFDVWDKEKIAKEGFKTTIRKTGGVSRVITPLDFSGDKVILKIDLVKGGFLTTEIHEMFLYDMDDIFEFAGDEFEVADFETTESWQMWWKLKRK